MNLNMKKGKFIITDNRRITADVLSMRLKGDTSAITAPGQFVEVSVPGFYLRRPISVCDVRGDELRLVYKVVGGGTDRMASMRPGEQMDILSGLGNGFSLPADPGHVLLVGGGVGVPPLYLLARCWIERGVTPTVILGFNKASEIILKEDFEALGIPDFEALGIPVFVSTADGSEGIKGFVTDAVPEIGFTPDFYQACGPIPMLRALAEALPEVTGELSLEERMGCGFGACMGCSIRTAKGPARVCTEGPVFPADVIDWKLL